MNWREELKWLVSAEGILCVFFFVLGFGSILWAVYLLGKVAGWILEFIGAIP